MIENRIRLIEALAFYTAHYGKSIEPELRAALWPEKSDFNRKRTLALLKNGNVKTIDLEKVHIICEFCEVTPDFLFSWDK